MIFNRTALDDWELVLSKSKETERPLRKQRQNGSIECTAYSLEEEEKEAEEEEEEDEKDDENKS